MARAWTDLELWLLGTGYYNGVPFDTMANAFGVSTSAIASRIKWRIVNPRAASPPNPGRKAKAPYAQRHNDSAFAYFEPWAVYHARKKAERAAAKKANSQ